MARTKRKPENEKGSVIAWGKIGFDVFSNFVLQAVDEGTDLHSGIRYFLWVIYIPLIATEIMNVYSSLETTIRHMELWPYLCLLHHLSHGLFMIVIKEKISFVPE